MYILFDDIKEGDIIGREVFPYQFFKIIKKNDSSIIFSFQNRPEEEFIMERRMFDGGQFFKHDIIDAEIVQRTFTPTPPTPTQPE